jgi:hypothetical protein
VVAGTLAGTWILSSVININAIGYLDGDAWIAQGIEYDIVAHASDVISLPDAFTRAVMENISISEHLGRKPLQGIKSAPKRFHEMFRTAKVEVRATNQSGLTEVSVRVAA